MSRRLLILTALVLLPACAEFTAEPTKTATRAVRGPDDTGTAEHEFNNPSNATAVPIAAIEFPTDKNDTFHFHTALDNARASTQPAATQPVQPPPIVPSHSTVNLTPTGTRP